MEPSSSAPSARSGARSTTAPSTRKIHGAWHVLTLAPRQVDALIAALYDGLADAEDTARVFYAEHGTIAERLAGKPHVLIQGQPYGEEYAAPTRGEA